MIENILIYDNGKCIGTLAVVDLVQPCTSIEVIRVPINGEIIELIRAPINGKVIDVVRVSNTNYGMVIPEHVANEMRNSVKEN